MQKHRLLLTLTLITLLLTPLATAKFSHSFDYTVFNSTALTWQTLDKTYESFQAKVYVSLTWDTTYNGTLSAEVRITDVANDTTNTGAKVCFNSAKLLDVWWMDNGTATKIGSITLQDYEEPIVVTYKDSKLYVGNSTHYNAYIDGFIAGEATFDYIGAKGDTGLTTAGYVSVEIDTAPISLDLNAALDVIYVTIPLIFTVAVLGVIIKMFKEVSK